LKPVIITSGDGSVAKSSITPGDTVDRNAQNSAHPIEQLFRSIFENAQIGIAYFRIDTQEHFSNRALHEMLGYSGEKLSRLEQWDETYGPVHDPANPYDGIERSLLGYFINSTIENQYEFVLGHWVTHKRLACIFGDHEVTYGVQPGRRSVVPAVQGQVESADDPYPGANSDAPGHQALPAVALWEQRSVSSWIGRLCEVFGHTVPEQPGGPSPKT
jgi:PAS domain-containing protein